MADPPRARSPSKAVRTCVGRQSTRGAPRWKPVEELTAYDGATGEARWTWDSPRGRGMDRLAGSSDQLVVAGGSYRPDATTGGTLVVSVDPDSGSTRWQVTLPEAQSNNLSAALLTVAGDTTFAAAGPTVYAIAAG